MNHLTLRKADLSDSAFAYHIKRAAFKEYVEQVRGWDEDEQQQLHARRFRKHDFRIINSNGIDVGIMAVTAASDCVHVHQFFLLPEYQSKGIGRECMSLVLEKARQLGLPVRLRVLKVNPRALAFYQRLGFARTGETDTHDLMERHPGNSGHVDQI